MKAIDCDFLEKRIHDHLIPLYYNGNNCDFKAGALSAISDILYMIKTSSAQPVQWIPCSERLPEEDHWLGGSGRQFSDEVMVSVANYDDEDIWIDISQTIDGQWALELPSHCEIIAWIPLPEPYTKRRGK